MFIKATFKQGEKLIWNHKNGTTEDVLFVRDSEATVAVPPTSPNHPEPLAVLERSVNGKEITVPLSELSRPE